MKFLKNSKQPGPDRIPNEIFKWIQECDTAFAILLKILNTILEKNWIPSTWKESLIYLIYKSDNPSNPLNYRPIALLNSFYKIYTALIAKRLSSFLEENEIFSNTQGGFREGKTTFHKIWILINIYQDAKINDKPLHVAFLDIKKAYDHVEH